MDITVSGSTSIVDRFTADEPDSEPTSELVQMKSGQEPTEVINPVYGRSDPADDETSSLPVTESAEQDALESRISVYKRQITTANLMFLWCGVSVALGSYFQTTVVLLTVLC